MGKRRKEKAEAEADGIPSPDGLEIVAIGSLLADKKYWSSSRGKDRHPYPVGYHALRSHADQTYRMEIRRGANGPLFVVTSDEGDCYSGHTPDAAWENFQKRNGPKAKNWRGRRLSSNVDGVELFGFKNPSVQRLLRELVASITETSEKGPLSLDFCCGVPLMDSEVPKQELRADPDMHLVSKKHKSVGKRARKKRGSCKINAIIPDKQLRSELPERHISTPKQGSTVHCASSKKVLASTEISSLVENQLLFYPSSDVGDGVNLNDDISCQRNQYTGVSVAAVLKLSTGCLENSPSSALHKSQTSDTGMCNLHKDSHLGGIASPKTNRSISLADVTLGELDDPLQVDLMIPNANSKLNFLQSSKSPDSHSAGMHPTITLDGYEGIPTLERIEPRASPHLCVPDTMDETQDNVEASVLEQKMHVGRMDDVINFKIKEPCPFSAEGNNVDPSVGNELPLVVRIVNSDNDDKSNQVTPILVESEGIIPPQHEVSMSSNSSSERTDLDSAGQELARSMMTFLLPRAVPLLKTTYFRKRKRAKTKKNENIFHNSDKQDIHLSSGGDHTFYIAPGSTETKLHGEGLHQNMKEKMYIGESLSKIKLPLNSDIDVNPSPSLKSKFEEIEHVDGNKAVIPDSFDDELFDAYAKLFPSYFDTVGADQSSSDKERSELITYMAHCGSEVCDGSTNDNCCCKDKSASEAIEGGNLFVSPSCMVHSTVEHLNSHSLGRPFMGKDEDASNVRISLGSSDMHSGQLNKVSNNNLSLEKHDHHGCRFRCNSAGLQECHIVRDETERVQLSLISKKDVEISKQNTSACRGSKCIDVQTNDTDQDSYQVFHGKKETGKVHTWEIQALKESNSTNSKGHMLPCSPNYFKKDGVPLSESIICRNIRSDDAPTEGIDLEATKVTKTISPFKTSFTKSSFRMKIPSRVSENELLAGTVSSEFVPYIRNNENSTSPPMSEMGFSTVATCAQGDSDNTYLEDCSKVSSEYISSDIPDVPPIYLCKEYEACLEPLGFYVHPKPVLSLLVEVKGGQVVLCVLCGHKENNKRDILIYRIASEQTTVHPSVSGYTSILLPTQDNLFNAREKVSIERSYMQISSDARFLFLQNGVKVLGCRDQSFDCLCSSCKSGCCKENGVKIAHVNFGFVSIIKKLKTATRVCCLLVCEPGYVIVSEETGKLHGWRMNSNWRETLEDFILPSSDDEPHLILELKRLPCQNSFIIGHNAEGSFLLWDIGNRVLLGKFSSPGSQIYEILPVGLCSFVKDVALNSLRMMELGSKNNRAKEVLFHGNGKDSSLPSADCEGFSVWLLVLTSSGSGIPHDILMQEPGMKPVRWRLALLVKDMAILGDILDPRACVMESRAGNGIAGTCDGFVYTWELSTGRKMMILNPFNGGKISCIAAASTSGALAVADDENRVVVYVPRNLACPVSKEFNRT